MSTMKLFVLIALLLFTGCKLDRIPPSVIQTDPRDGSMDVFPTLSEISVTFSEPMKDKNWSWCYEEKKHFPETMGEAYYTDNNTRCVLPVKLQPNTEYIIWINLNKFNNFRDRSGNPVKPYKFMFSTTDDTYRN
ncbi:MAG: hypothetical protein E3J78_02570 [Candidatus Cloacimonadota bacterium]|nr:MAG: hypothetical protein E3J78_02570 [Candidatus Cloacimonadota bacterium]